MQTCVIFIVVATSLVVMDNKEFKSDFYKRVCGYIKQSKSGDFSAAQRNPDEISHEDRLELLLE